MIPEIELAKVAVVEFIFWGIVLGTLLGCALLIADAIYYALTGKSKINLEP